MISGPENLPTHQSSIRTFVCQSRNMSAAEWADGHGQEQLDDICHWPPLVTNPVTCQVSFWVTLSKSSFTCSFVHPTRWNWTNETKSKKKRSVQTANDIPIEIDRVGLYLRDRERLVTNLRCV